MLLIEVQSFWANAQHNSDFKIGFNIFNSKKKKIGFNIL